MAWLSMLFCHPGHWRRVSACHLVPFARLTITFFIYRVLFSIVVDLPSMPAGWKSICILWADLSFMPDTTRQIASGDIVFGGSGGTFTLTRVPEPSTLLLLLAGLSLIATLHIVIRS